MQIIIFTSKRRKQMLQQILDWGISQPLKFQMYFTKDLNKIKSLILDKNCFPVTTEKKLYILLKEQGIKISLVEKNWEYGAKIV